MTNITFIDKAIEIKEIVSFSVFVFMFILAVYGIPLFFIFTFMVLLFEIGTTSVFLSELSITTVSIRLFMTVAPWAILCLAASGIALQIKFICGTSFKNDRNESYEDSKNPFVQKDIRVFEYVRCN